VSVRGCKPWVPEDEVIQPHIGDIETQEARDVSCDDFKFGVIPQAPSGVRRAISVLEFSRVFHKMYS
jgi:hypothetical protein